MTDEELERHLRAWFRDEIAPDETAPLALRSLLGTIPVVAPSPWSGTAGRRRIGMLAVAAVLTTLLAGGALIGLGAFRDSPDTPPSDPALVIAPSPLASVPVPTAPVPTPRRAEPSATPAPTPFAPPAPCLQGSSQVLAGDELPTPGSLTQAEMSMGRGVYTVVDPRYSSLWAFGPDGGAPSRVAAVTPPPTELTALDISPDGSGALARVTAPAEGDRSTPGCSELYLVRLDGSGVTRLTTESAGGFISGAAHSPDGRRIAYVRWSPMTVTVLDLATGSRVDGPCETGSDGNDLTTSTVAWSPGGKWVAAECGGALYIVDPSGATAPVRYPRGDYSVAFQWTSDRTLLVARDTGGLAMRDFHVDSFDVATGTATVIGQVDGANLEDLMGTFRFSPDGRWLAFTAGVLTAVPMEQIAFVGYMVPVTGGAPIRVLTQEEASGIIGWSTLSRRLLFLAPDGVLVGMDIDTPQRFNVGKVPDGYRQGVWRIP